MCHCPHKQEPVYPRPQQYHHSHAVHSSSHIFFPPSRVSIGRRRMCTVQTVTTGALDEMPDSMTLDTMQQPTLSPSPSPSRDRPTHPASDITALREAVSAAFAQGPSDQKTSPRSRNSASSRSHPPQIQPADTISRSVLQQPASSMSTVPLQSTYVSSESSSKRPLQPDLRELSLRHARLHV